MSVSAVRARLAQQENSSISRPRHNILAPPFSLVSPPERGGAVEIMVLKFWARRTRSRVVAGGRSCTIALGVRMPAPPSLPRHYRTRHGLDSTKLKTVLCFCAFPNFDNVSFDQEKERPIRSRALASPPPLLLAGWQAVWLVALISRPAHLNPPVGTLQSVP